MNQYSVPMQQRVRSSAATGFCPRSGPFFGEAGRQGSIRALILLARDALGACNRVVEKKSVRGPVRERFKLYSNRAATSGRGRYGSEQQRR